MACSRSLPVPEIKIKGSCNEECIYQGSQPAVAISPPTTLGNDGPSNHQRIRGSAPAAGRPRRLRTDSSFRTHRRGSGFERTTRVIGPGSGTTLAGEIKTVTEEPVQAMFLIILPSFPTFCGERSASANCSSTRRNTNGDIAATTSTAGTLSFLRRGRSIPPATRRCASRLATL